MAAMEALLFRGLYRTSAWAYVTNEIMSFHVPEAEYRVFGYEPDYDSLPGKRVISPLNKVTKLARVEEAFVNRISVKSVCAVPRAYPLTEML